ncbi:MAG: 16S rRNA (adenine(1518)-N(6)/adenine(1519)-N(6))-dimethyltransferase RsmA [Clostridiales bacterium]|nr:16S rRNA (adenine(1518)-N(6)/adenine(1519)-N(6))-dimethyltransferase RsmA [Clostridiales bacterium]
MRHIASAPVVRRLLRELEINPSKSLGQNFLICENVAEKICSASGAGTGDNVLEIGPGLGALSEHLALNAGYLTLLELDGRLAAYLRRVFAANGQVEVLQGDALSFGYAAYEAARHWDSHLTVANLPYSITSQLIQRLLLHGGLWRGLTLMMQQEVAQKLLPLPGGGTNGPLALLTQYFGTVKMLFTVPNECFFPVPRVESAVIQVIRHKQPPFAVESPERFARFLNAAFSHRRKTLENSFNNSLGGGTGFWRQALYACGVGENKRGEELSLADYGALFALPLVKEYLQKNLY